MKKILLTIIISSLLTVFSVQAATIYTTSISDTYGTFRTNVNNSLNNLNLFGPASTSTLSLQGVTSTNALFTNGTSTNWGATNLWVSTLNGIAKMTNGLISAATAGVDYLTNANVWGQSLYATSSPSFSTLNASSVISDSGDFTTLNAGTLLIDNVASGYIQVQGSATTTLYGTGATSTFGGSVNLTATSGYYIGNNLIASSTSLGSGVLDSSLRSVGTVGTGLWQGTPIADAYIAGASTWSGKASSSLTLTAGAGLTGGGDLSANRTFTLNMAGITCGAGQHISQANATGTFVCSADTVGSVNTTFATTSIGVNIGTTTFSGGNLRIGSSTYGVVFSDGSIQNTGYKPLGGVTIPAPSSTTDIAVFAGSPYSTSTATLVTCVADGDSVSLTVMNNGVSFASTTCSNATGKVSSSSLSSVIGNLKDITIRILSTTSYSSTSSVGIGIYGTQSNP